MNSALARWLPPGVTATALVLRIALFLLPCAALAMALPERPHLLVVVAVLFCAGWWATTPDHVTGAIGLAVVAGWWTTHDVLDWRVPVVAVLLLAAHVVATLLSYGPAALPVDPRLARRWLGRGLLALVPVPITYAALRGLDAELAPVWIWMSAALIVVALIVATLRLMQPVDDAGPGSSADDGQGGGTIGVGSAR